MSEIEIGNLTKSDLVARLEGGSRCVNSGVLRQFIIDVSTALGDKNFLIDVRLDHDGMVEFSVPLDD